MVNLLQAILAGSMLSFGIKAQAPKDGDSSPSQKIVVGRRGKGRGKSGLRFKYRAPSVDLAPGLGRRGFRANFLTPKIRTCTRRSAGGHAGLPGWSSLPLDDAVCVLRRKNCDAVDWVNGSPH